jgi:acyl-ACP thioesterase
VDVAAHVNNSHYWAPLEEELAGRELASLDAEIEYRDPAQPGEFVVLSDGAARWIASPDGTLHASIVLNEPRAEG